MIRRLARWLGLIEPDRPEVEPGPPAAIWLLVLRNESTFGPVYTTMLAADLDEHRRFIRFNHQNKAEYPLSYSAPVALWVLRPGAEWVRSAVIEIPADS